MAIREWGQILIERIRLARIHAARRKLTRLLETTPRYWRAAQIGTPSMIDLGCITMQGALASVAEAGYAPAHVDLENAFIALSADNLASKAI